MVTTDTKKSLKNSSKTNFILIILLIFIIVTLSPFFWKYHLPTVPATVMVPIALTKPEDQNHTNKCQKARKTSVEVLLSIALET